MLDYRTKRTLIENSPVTTQTPSWSLFSFDVIYQEFYRPIDRSGDSSVYDHLFRHYAPSDFATNELFFAHRARDSSTHRVANSDLFYSHRIIVSGILRLRSSIPNSRSIGIRSKEFIGHPELTSLQFITFYLDQQRTQRIITF